MHCTKVRFIAVALALGLGGCVTTGRDPGVALLPLAPQSGELFQCGPATLAAVLSFYGTAVDEATIARAIYSASARGVLLTDLAWYARSRGFATELRTGTLQDLQQAVQAGTPPIVLLDLGLSRVHQPHITAITGMSATGIHYQSTQPVGKVVSPTKFNRQWERAGNQFLLVTRSR